MCGIVGYVQSQQTSIDVDNQYRRAMGELLFMDTLRGFDSTGIACIPKYDAKGAFVIKKAIPGFAFIDTADYKRVLRAQSQPGIFLGHNRAATRGAISDENAHPFEAGEKGNRVILVHNGSLLSYTNLKADVKSTVDSCHIAHAIAQHGAAETLPRLDGSAILVWWNEKENSMNIARTKDRAIAWIFDEHNTCWFGSEYDMVFAALKRNGIKMRGNFLQLPEFHHYKWELTVDEKDVFPGKLTKVKFDEYVPDWKLKNQQWEKDRAKQGTHYNHGYSCGLGAGDDDDDAGDKNSGTVIVVRRHEVFSKRKLNKVSKELATYSLDVGDELEVTRMGWTSSINNKSIGDIECKWVQKGMKVILADVPKSLWNRTASNRYHVNVYNVKMEPILGTGSHEPVLYAKIKEDKLADLVQGPDSKLITKTQFENLAEDGCGWCGKQVNLADHEDVAWNKDRPLCRVCSVNHARYSGEND